MGLLSNRSEDDEERDEIRITGFNGLDIGAPEETVYELADWAEHDRTALQERLEMLALPHRWEGMSLVVAPSTEAWVERVMDQVEEELADKLDSGDEQIAYDLAGWDDTNRQTLFDGLDADRIPFGVEGDELFVRAIDEPRVDEVVDSIIGPEEGVEARGQVGPEVMGEMFVAADRLSHDPRDHEGTMTIIRMLRASQGTNPPYGTDRGWWDRVVTHAEQIVSLLDTPDPDVDAIGDEAAALRDTLRPFV
ncbi:MAG: hypothetical protein WD691_07515 [Acidimicrobiales bacterium]